MLHAVFAADYLLSKPMSLPEVSTSKRTVAWSLAILAGLATSCVCLFFWLLVGVFTRVIAICSGAPYWWSVTYLWLTLLMVVPGFYAGRVTYRWFVEKEQRRLDVKE